MGMAEDAFFRTLTLPGEEQAPSDEEKENTEEQTSLRLRPPGSPGVNRVLSIVGVEDLTLHQIFEIAPNLSVVTEVDLSLTRIPTARFIEVVEVMMPELTRLTTLDLKNNRIGPDGCVHLFRLLHQHCKRLRYLDVSDNNIGDESIEALVPLLADGEIEALGLANNHITPCGIVELNHGIEKNDLLTELALCGNELGDLGVLELAEVALCHSGLTMLDLSSNGIGDHGAIGLAHQLASNKQSPLRQLNLAMNEIGDEGLAAISEALCSSSRLVRLDLGRNAHITAAGRREFTRSAAKWRSIEYLDLTSCDLDERDGTSLAKAIQTSKCSLKGVVVVNNSKLTPQAIQSLQRASERKELDPMGNSFRSLAMDSAVLTGLSISCLVATGIAAAILYRKL